MKPPERTSTPRDTKSVLYEAALEAVQERAARARARAEQRPRPRRRFPRLAFLIAVAVIGGALLLIRPAWLAGPDRLPPESPAVAAASMRVILWRERELVQAFQQRTGRLPASLGEAGSTAVGLEYRQDGTGFRLIGRAGDSLITLRSSDSAAAFLGDSFSRLRQRSLP
jgi:hypothetical protein